ncbi:MAG: hypothetical protein R3B82_29710, partial [Sandaracinaceae bacterium]
DPVVASGLDVSLHDGARIATTQAPSFFEGVDLADPAHAVAAGDSEGHLTTECGHDADEYAYVCVGRFQVRHLAPGGTGQLNVRFRTYPPGIGGRLDESTTGLFEDTEITFVSTPEVEDAGPRTDLDAGPDEDASVGGGCAELPCVNGTRTTDGEGACRCVCDVGYRGGACDRRDPATRTLPGTFADPRGVAIDPSSATLVVVSGQDGTVERVGFDGAGRVTVVPGVAGRQLLDVAVADDGTIYVLAASTFGPWLHRVADGTLVPISLGLPSVSGVAWIDGALWVASLGQGGRVDDSGATPTFVSVAGSGLPARAPQDGVGRAAQFGEALDLAGAPDGTVLVTDGGNGTGGALRVLDPVTGQVTTVYGANGPLPGDRASGYVQTPIGLAVDAAGGVYVAERVAHRVRWLSRFSATLWLSEDVAGERYEGSLDFDGTPGHVDGPATVSRLHFPSSLALSPDGRMLFVADAGNDAVRVVDL